MPVGKAKAMKKTCCPVLEVRQFLLESLKSLAGAHVGTTLMMMTRNSGAWSFMWVGVMMLRPVVVTLDEHPVSVQ